MRGLNRSWLLFATAALAVVWSGQGTADTPETGAQRAFDRAVIDEINAARSDPKGYAERLKAPASPAQIAEAQAFLRSQAPVAPLMFDDRLARAAEAHAADQGPLGQVSHVGSDGSRLSQRVQKVGLWSTIYAEVISVGPTAAQLAVGQLIVDIPGPMHPHRTDLFDPMLKRVGVGCGPNAKFGEMCVVDLSADAVGGARGEEIAAVGEHATTTAGPPPPPPPPPQTTTRPPPSPPPPPTTATVPGDIAAVTQSSITCPWPSGKIAANMVDNELYWYPIIGTRFATFDDLLSELESQVGHYDPRGTCGHCLAQVTIWAHGESKGHNGILYIGSEHAIFPGGQTMGADFNAKLAKLAALMCRPDGKLVFNSCNAGYGQRGTDVLSEVSKRMGGLAVSGPEDEISGCSLGGALTSYKTAKGGEVPQDNRPAPHQPAK